MLALAVMFLLLAVVRPASGRQAAGSFADGQTRADPGVLSRASEALLDEARYYVFRLELVDAERTLYRLAGRADGEAPALLRLAMVSLIRAMMQDDESDFERFFERSDSLKDNLDDAPRGAWRTMIQAEADYHRAIAWAGKGRYVQAAMAGVSAYRLYGESLEQEPGFAEPLKGRGLFHTLIGVLPSSYQRFLRLFGFNGTYDQGLVELTRATESARYVADEARMYLALLDIYGLPTPISGLEVYESLFARYDGALFVALPYLEALMRERRIDRADSVLSVVRERRDAGRVANVSFFRYFEGAVAFLKNDFGTAAAHYREYTEEYRGTAFQAPAHLRLGLSLDLQGRREEAVEAYRSVVAPREFHSDAVHERRARQLIQRPPNRHERDLLRAANAFDGGNDAVADSSLALLWQDDELPDALRAEIRYRQGRVLEEQGRLQEALDFFGWAADHPGDLQDKWAPSALLRMAVIRMESDQKPEARAALRRMLEWDGDYDYRDSMQRRAKLLLADLGEN